MRIGFLARPLLLVSALTVACGAGPHLMETGPLDPREPLFVPEAPAPTLDGALYRDEWAAARVFPLAKEGHVRMLRSGNRLYLGVQHGRGAGTPLIGIAKGKEIRIGRDSGVQATIGYRLESGRWHRRSNFSWVEVRRDNRGAVEEHFERAGWVAVGGGKGDEGVVEYCINVPKEGLRLALSKIGLRRRNPQPHWPPGLEDDLVGGLLTGEIAPTILDFDPENWARIDYLPPEPPRPPEPRPADDGSPLAGAWRVAEINYVWEGGEAPLRDPLPGQFLFVDGNYSMVWHQQFRRQADYAEPWRPTDAERIESYNGIVVNAGTYELRGDTLTTRPAVAKTVEFEGGEAGWFWRVEADTLWLRSGVVLNYKGEMDPGSDELSTRIRCERIR